MHVFEFPLPPTLNEQLNTARKNKFSSAVLKREWTTNISKSLLGVNTPKFKEPIWLAVSIGYRKKSSDPDNLFASLKYVFDGMVRAGVFPNDTVAFIQSPIYYSYYQTKEPQVTLTVFESINEYINHVQRNLIKEISKHKSLTK